MFGFRQCSYPGKTLGLGTSMCGLSCGNSVLPGTMASISSVLPGTGKSKDAVCLIKFRFNPHIIHTLSDPVMFSSCFLS